MDVPTSTTTIITTPPPPLPPPLHVVVFPYMAHGHTIPLIDLSKALAGRGLRVTIITTTLNASFIHSQISSSTNAISVSVIPFPKVKELPEGCENTAHLPSMELLLPFVRANRLLQQPFEDILQDMIVNTETAGLPICVISDLFLGWTLDSCRRFGIPRIVFQGMGALPMVIIKALTLHAPAMLGGLPCSAEIQLSTVCPSSSVPFPILKADMPLVAREADPDNEFFKVTTEHEEAGSNSWGVLVNSFEQLEGGKNIAALESLYQEDARAWCLGPFFLLNDDQINEKNDTKQSCSHINEWLEQQVEPSRVLFVSFGSEAALSNMQMDEIAFGLEMAGQPFIWKIRSSTWVPPNGWEQRVEEMGLVESGWVDQRRILKHPAVGGFLSHCGWNSVLESLSLGVPLLTWPVAADQPLNAKYVAVGLRAGIMIPQECDEGGQIMTVDRSVICEKVKELMRGDAGRNARERAQELGRMARTAVEKGGSSHKKLDQLIECLALKQKRSNGV